MVDFSALLQHPGETDVLGDIEHWASAYLESGLHLQDWDQRMESQQARFAEFVQAPLGFQPFPATPPPLEEAE